MDKPIKYFELSTNDSGGAGYTALKTIERRRKLGYDAKLIVLNKHSDSDAVIGIYDSHKWIDRLVLLLLRISAIIQKKVIYAIRNSKYNFYDIQLNRASAKKILKLYGDQPDYILVGWVTDFVSAKTIYNLKELTGAKIVYIMTDNSPLGGGCHYPWDCLGYTSNCYPCPALRKDSHRAQRTLLSKHKYITNDMTISGTTNDINRAKKSLLFKGSKQIVSASLKPNPYSFSKNVGRELWDIDDSRYVIFCGAASINAERKGFKKLLCALETLKEEIGDVSNILILMAGDNTVPMPEGFNVKFVGKLNFEDLFKAYCCADLFVCPSLEDSGPMMVNYGVMAYIPVVAFEMGIVPDIIIHKKNGYIAKWGDVNDFAKGIEYCIKNKDSLFKDIKSINDSLMEKTRSEKSLYKTLGFE